MTALNRFQFNGYTLRPADRQDLLLAHTWTSQDKYHAGKINPAFWLEQGLGIDSILLSDGMGPVFFCKVVTREFIPVTIPDPLPAHLSGLARETVLTLYKPTEVISKIAAEVFIQFMPQETEEDTERTRCALANGFPWLETVLAQSSIEEIFFDSEDEKLIAFCRKRLGFSIDSSIRPGAGLRMRKVLTA